MDFSTIDRYLREKLLIDKIPDISINGLQVGQMYKDIRTVSFAVDANIKTIKKAIKNGSDLLIVHHGIFWGKQFPLIGSNYEKIRLLVENKLSLYAIHLPLDMHKELGNNYTIAKILGIRELKDFGNYHGINIGCWGIYDGDLDAVRKLSSTVSIFINNDRKIEKVAIVSGKAGTEIMEEYISSGLDLFITGEIEHSIYNRILDADVNVIALGHYESEKFGLLELEKDLKNTFNINTFFIDCPTFF